MGTRCDFTVLPWTRLATLITMYIHCMGTCGGSATQLCSSSSVGRCFQVDTSAFTWWQANRTCGERGGMLAAIRTPEDKSAVETFARSHNNIPVWTGGKVVDYGWRWNGRRSYGLQYQGCYKDKVSDPDLNVHLETSASLTPSICAERCKAAGQNYAISGVQFNANNQVVCRCGKNSNEYVLQRDTRCQRPCPSVTQSGDMYYRKEREELDRFCGNPEAQIVALIWGLPFHYWLSPEDQGEHECAALDHSAMFRWRDFHCNKARLAHICEYDTPESNCQYPKLWIRKSSSSGVCISKHTDRKSWYEARKDCRQRGGFLLEIRDHQLQQELEIRLMGTGETFWIALKRRTWKWPDGTKPESFVDWKDEEPMRTDGNKNRCILMNPPSYKWKSKACNLQYSFVCEYTDGPLQPPPPPAPAPSPVHSQTSVPTAVPPPNPPQNPLNGQGGQQQQPLDPAIIGGAAGGGAVLLLIVIAVIAYCCCCKKNSQKKSTMKKAHRSRAKPRTPSGHNNHAFSSREKGKHHRKDPTHKSRGPLAARAQRKADTYIQKPPLTEKTPNDNHYLSLKSCEPPKDGVYEELAVGDPTYTDDGYLNITDQRRPKDYDNIKQSPPPHDNYQHYLKPRR